MTADTSIHGDYAYTAERPLGGGGPAGPTVVWLRRQLRLRRNPALQAASEQGGPVVPVALWPDAGGAWAPGAATRWWLRRSLIALADDLREHGSRLVIREGPPIAAIVGLVRETRATQVVWPHGCEPAEEEDDLRLMGALRAAGVEARLTPPDLLFGPDDVRTREGRPFRSFTPFWRVCGSLPEPALPDDRPFAAPRPEDWPAGSDPERLPRDGADAGSELRLDGVWRPGEAGARERLDGFLRDGVASYETARDRPDVEGTSRLSPHLHFGEVGVAEVWHAIRGMADGSAQVFRSELGWREFGYHLLHHEPDSPIQPLRREFAAFPWDDDPEGLEAWREGGTGYPLVDAGMRQLRQTGWMHNRVRMVAASFLVKDLLLPWQAGARHFWERLVDADLASNTLGWQWTAGCGADAAPYFRVFNPVLQGSRFDPEGAYVRAWVPELGRMPSRWVHRPASAPPAVLEEAGVRLGITYPRPLVDHAAARLRALAAFRHLRTVGQPGMPPPAVAPGRPGTLVDDRGARRSRR